MSCNQVMSFYSGGILSAQLRTLSNIEARIVCVGVILFRTSIAIFSPASEVIDLAFVYLAEAHVENACEIT